MKQFLRLVIVILSVALLEGCSKGSPGPGGGPGPGLNIWYPATRTVTTSAGSFVEKYEYDSEHRLTKFGRDNVLYRAVSGQATNQVTFLPSAVVTTAYAWTLANGTATTADIYTGLPTGVLVTEFQKNLVSGTTSSRPLYSYTFTYGGEYLTKEITSDGGGKNNNFSYDDKKNLKLIEVVPLTGPRYPNVTNNIKVTALDGNPSPFFAVKGYRFASWPQISAADYALAFCHNNPTQIVLENFDINKNVMVPFEQNDFKYTYNENGYPTRIDVSITYIATNGTKTSNSISYAYTYQQ